MQIFVRLFVCLSDESLSIALKPHLFGSYVCLRQDVGKSELKILHSITISPDIFIVS